MGWVRVDVAEGEAVVVKAQIADDFDFLYVAANHRVVGGNHSHFVVCSWTKVGNLCGDGSASVGGHPTEFDGIAEITIGIGELCDDLIGFAVEVVGAHGAVQCERNLNAFANFEMCLGKLLQTKRWIVNQQDVVNKQVVAVAAFARDGVGGNGEKQISDIVAGSVFLERNAEPLPNEFAIGGSGAREAFRAVATSLSKGSSVPFAISL